jgi:DNA invertase Pin-like site-specific DNA recombinase
VLVKVLRNCLENTSGVFRNDDWKAGLPPFGVLAEFEHALIRERTMAGQAAVSVRGDKGGRQQNHAGLLWFLLFGLIWGFRKARQ